MKPVYEYKGFQYVPYDDVEPNECSKIMHEVKTPTGETIHLDMSPYTKPTETTFKKWVDLGCPKTELMQPNFSAEDIDKMFDNRKEFRSLPDMEYGSDLFLAVTVISKKDSIDPAILKRIIVIGLHNMTTGEKLLVYEALGMKL